MTIKENQQVKYLSKTLSFTLLLFSSILYAVEHAPIGVMGDHTHHKGEWMISYRYMHMDMDDNYDGSSSISRNDIFAKGYMVAPSKMTMEMHMLGLMYAPTHDFTLMLMLPYVKKSMDLVMRPMMMNGMMGNMNGMMMGPTKFTTKSSGIGDVKLTGLVKIYDTDTHDIHLNLGMSFPTGSIDERDDTAMQQNAKLPYPMQNGSGTYDLLLGITYTGRTGPLDYSWGAQGNAVVRLGDNDNDYRLGNRYNLTAWAAKHWAPWFNTSIRINGEHWDDIHGEDDDLRMAKNMVPTADPDNQGGSRIDLSLGLNFHVQEGALTDHRFAIEYGMPIYQDLNGPQMATNWTLTAGWQLSF